MKNIRKTLSILTVTSIFFSLQASTLENSSQNQRKKFNHSRSMKDKQQYWMEKRRSDFLLAPIKNRKELDKYLEITPIEKSPLGALPEIEREIFVNSLTFTNKGVAGFDHSMLSYGPTATEVYNILSLFGTQSMTPFLPGLTVASESDSSIMAVSKIMQGDFILLNSSCIWNADIRQFFCGRRGLEICFPKICL
ncbi:hypothetical protein [Microbulbifer sp. TRSA005]|uniref:hypothetical protein n=1 Tax=Microbulbifer sp. TRSA005 TaxID=3243383 RepID=UPI004039A224